MTIYFSSLLAIVAVLFSSLSKFVYSLVCTKVENEKSFGFPGETVTLIGINVSLSN